MLSNQSGGVAFITQST